MNRTPILFLNVLLIATCGLVYELLAGTVASYVLGDSVRQFSLIIGIYLSAMGVGAWLSRYIDTALARTFVEVATEDRIGLLYTLAQTLAELGVDIVTARICTEKGAAIDTFYVHEVDGGKLTSPERQRVIERQLRHAIHELDARAKKI